MSAMNSASNIHLPDATGTPEEAEPFQYAARGPVTSPVAIMRTARMRLASEPNDGTPISHRNRGQAERRG